MQNIFTKIVKAFYIINALLFLFAFSIVDLKGASKDVIVLMIITFTIGLSMVFYAFGDSMLKRFSTKYDLSKVNFYTVKSIAYLFLAISIYFAFYDFIYSNLIENIEIQKQSIVLVSAYLFEGILILLYLNQSEKKKLILEDNINLG